MKRILITGAGSFIGQSFENWMLQRKDEYEIDTVDMTDASWREKDFSSYDTVFHVAGIAHADVGKVTDEEQALYYKVNTDLTVETALKAKNDGVKQFIFMSSIIVYGDSGNIYETKVITRETKPSPANFYGDSKLKAEEGLQKLQSDLFKIAIIRPPMIYGKGSKGNYPTLAKFASKSPIFPDINNQRSMLYIDNLCEFVRLICKNNDSGIFCPQNSVYVRTSDMVSMIARAHNKKIRLTKIFNPLLRLAGHFSGIVNKAFGNMVYDMSMSDYHENYRVVDFKTSIFDTESEA